MLQNWFILLPEICLVSFLVVAWLTELLREEKTAKTFYSIAQFFLLASLSSTILFYNKSAFPYLWQNSSFTTLFKTFVYLLAWAWFYLSSKWFLNKNRPSLKFYSICFGLLFSFSILASSSSIITLALIIPIICYLHYLLILRHWDIERVRVTASTYAWCSTLFCILLFVGVSIIYFQTESFEYLKIKQYLLMNKTYTFQFLLGILFILSCFMFLMAIVPFHHWFVAFVSNGVLPVCGFITLVPPLIYLCAFINLISKCLAPLSNFIVPLISIFATLSIIIGALSSNRETNIRRLFGYLSIYCLSFAIIGLQNFSDKSIIASFAYITIAILSLTGVYTVFLSLKSRGDYLSEVNSISGFYTMRPYMSAALLVFMFSLIGLAPTLGFFGYLSVINNLVSSNEWFRVTLLLGSLLFVAGACLQIVRIIYFESPTTKFDRSDKSIYICLFINVLFILISLINPAWLLHDALVILGGIS